MKYLKFRIPKGFEVRGYKPKVIPLPSINEIYITFEKKVKKTRGKKK